MNMLAVSCCGFAIACSLLLPYCEGMQDGQSRNADERIKSIVSETVENLSWQHASDHCDSLDKRLCTRKDLCRPNGDRFLPRKAFIFFRGDRWVPVSNAFNDWVYLGQTPTLRCQRLSDTDGPPTWGGKNCSDYRIRKSDKTIRRFCVSTGTFYCCPKDTNTQPTTPHLVTVYVKSRMPKDTPFYSFSLKEQLSENEGFSDQAQWRERGRLSGDLSKFTMFSDYVKKRFEHPVFFCTRSITTSARLPTNLHKVSNTWCMYPWKLNFYLYGSFTPATGKRMKNQDTLLVGMQGAGSEANSRLSLVANNNFPPKFEFYVPKSKRRNYIEFAKPAQYGCRSEIEELTSNSGRINSPEYPGKFNRGATADTNCHWKIKVDSKSVIRITFKTLKLTEAKKTTVLPFQFRSFQGSTKLFNFEQNCRVDRVVIPGYGTFCGNAIPPSFVTITNEVSIQFHGERGSNGISFSLFYEAISSSNGLTMTKITNGLKNFTWMSAKESCEFRDKTLCSAKDICSFDKRPFYGVEFEDHWAPIGDEYNDWLQIGRGNVPTCKRHSKSFGPPQWGVRKGSCNSVNISRPCPTRESLYCCDSGKSTQLPKSNPITVKILSTVQNGIIFFKYVRDGVDDDDSFDSSDIWTPNRKRRGDFTSITLHTNYEAGIEKVVYFCWKKLVPAIGRLTKAYSMFLQPCESKGWKLLYYLYSLGRRQKNTFMHYIGIYEKWPHHSRAHFKAFPDNFQGKDAFVLFSYSSAIPHNDTKFIQGSRDSACNGTASVIIAPSILESPGYPTTYENDLLCRWHIKLPDGDKEKGNRLKITIEELNLEDPVDTLTVYEVASTVDLAKTSSFVDSVQVFKSRKDFTGMVGQVSLETTDSFLLVFNSDDSVSRKGFKLAAVILSNECGGDVTGHGDEITSPNYPYRYSGGLLCKWNIRAPDDNHFIEIEFDSFDLTNSSVCQDSLRLEADGADDNLFCGGETTPRSLAIESRFAVLTFKTTMTTDRKPSEGGKGFSLKIYFRPKNNTEKKQATFGRQCGIQTVPFAKVEAARERIIGGAEAQNGNFPWTVMIGKPGISCGGALINERFVLTATHCFVYDYIPSLGLMIMLENLRNYVVIAGRYERNKPSPGEQHFNITNIYMHGGFKRYQVKWHENGLNILGVFPYNDITVAHLSSKAVFSPTVSPVCLPTQDAHVGEFCYVSGWGSVIGSGVRMTSALKYAKVPILDNSLCDSWTELKGTIFDNAICAGYPNGGSDHCWGDSGGPLVCRGSFGNFYINGIVSWSRKCGGKRTPGIYTRVWPFYDWINKIITNY